MTILESFCFLVQRKDFYAQVRTGTQ